MKTKFTKTLSLLLVFILTVSMMSMPTFAVTKTNEERIAALKEKYQVVVTPGTRRVGDHFYPMSDSVIASNLTSLEKGYAYLGSGLIKLTANNRSMKTIEITLNEISKEFYEFQSKYEEDDLWCQRIGNTLEGYDVPPIEVIRDISYLFVNVTINDDISNGGAFRDWDPICFEVQVAYTPNGKPNPAKNGDFISEKAKESLVDNYTEVFTWGIYYGADKPCPYPKDNQVYKCAKAVYNDLVKHVGYNSMATQRMAGYLGIDISKELSALKK